MYDILTIKYDGTTVLAPTIPRETQHFGHGAPLDYVVMGDSTSIGQGAQYDQSYAYQSAQHLAQKYSVSLTNVGVSGARAKDVETMQLPKVLKMHADVIVIAVGANDLTHFTKTSALRTSMQNIIVALQKHDPTTRIIITGSPAMGAVPRFPWPANLLASHKVVALNNGVFIPLAQKYGLTFAPIAAKTAAAFAADPTLFAQDKFHPDARGYALWTPVIDDALDQALNTTN